MAFFGIFGTLLGVILGYFLSLNAAKSQCRRIAGAKLRAAFAPEIAQYDLIEEGKIYDMLVAALPKHAAAIEEFRCYVPRKHQKDYQDAWNNYHRPPDARGMIYLTCYAVGKDRRELFKKNTDAILKFAEI
jgi:hypothetical protein